MTRRSRRSRWRRSRRCDVDDFDEMSVPKRYDNKPNLSIVHFVQKFRCQSFWAVCDAFNFNVTLRRATLYRASDRRSFREWRLEKFFYKKTLEGNNYFDAAAAAVWPSNPHAQMPNYQQHRPDRTPLRVRVCVRAVRADEGESRVRVVRVCVCVKMGGGRALD